MYFDEDTIAKCTIRCFGAGILFTLVSGITLAKVNHISNVFKFKRRASQHEIIQLYTMEIVVVIISLAVEIFLIIVVMQIKPIEINDIPDVSTNYIYCDVEFHRNAQLVYFFILQGICFVKGFIERKLPEAYNETSFIALAMFTSVLITVISIPLTNSYTNPKEQKIVLLLTLLAVNRSTFLIMYGYKVFLICKYSSLFLENGYHRNNHLGL